MASFPFAQGVGHEGKPTVGPSAPSLSPEAEDLALRELKKRLSVTPHDEKSWLVHVQRVRPELADDAHLLRFLQVEDYNVELALKRLLKYWELRYKVFGPDKYALPMTLNGAMRGCLDDLRNSNLVLLPVLDRDGSPILYRNTRTYPKQFIKVWWYLVHVAMENPSAAKNGFVVISNAASMKFADYDPQIVVACFSSAGYAFTIRWKMLHVVNLPSVFPRMAAAVKAALPLHLREIFLLHTKSGEDMLRSLAEYGLGRDCLPREMGGNLDVSTEAFVQHRLAVEGADINLGKEKTTATLAGKVCTSSNDAGEGLSGVTVSALLAPAKNAGSLSGSFSVAGQNVISQTNVGAHMETSPFGPIVGNEALMLLCGKAMPPNDEASRKRKNEDRSSQATQNSKPKPPVRGRGKGNGRGRLGDPRMDRAMQMRIDNPDMTLAAALEAGGYIFPDLENPKGKVGDVLDTEGVTLYQRRNQLLRRLREAKKKAQGG